MKQIGEKNWSNKPENTSFQCQTLCPKMTLSVDLS